MRQMKDSGVEWIGSIPANWQIGKVKFAFVRKNAEAHQDNPVVLSLARSGVKIRDISSGEGQIADSYYNYNPVEEGDFLLNPMDLYSGANCSTSKVKGVISPAYINLRAKKGFSAEYYDYFFKTQYWSMAMFAHGKGVSFDNRWTLGTNDLLNYYIPIPSYSEQLAITSILNNKCARIDTIIEKTKASIEEYKKLKQAIITQAVTKGLHDNRLMKDSGVDWIGEIPEEWNMLRKLSYAVTEGISYGIVKLFEPDDENGVRVIRCSDVREGVIVPDNIRTVTKEVSDEYKRTILCGGEVLVNVRGTLGGCAVVPEEMSGYNIAREVAKISLDSSMNSNYVMYYLLSSCFADYRTRFLSGSVYVGLNIEMLSSCAVVKPPLEEQAEIVAFLDNKCSEINSIILSKENLLTELESYKKSLIYEYVTGKKEA